MAVEEGTPEANGTADVADGRRRRPLWMYVMLVLAVVSLAFSPILVRLTGNVPGVAIAVWRTAIAALLILPVALVHERGRLRSLSWREVALIGVSGVMLGLHFIVWIESLFHTTVASASVLVTTSPAFLIVLGYIVLDERLSRRTIVAIGVAVLGAVLLNWGDVVAVEAVAPNPLLGNTMALFAALLVSLYLLIGRVVRRRTAWLTYVAPLYSVAALTTLVAALVRGIPLTGYGPAFYVLCALMAIGPQLLGHGVFNYALAYFPAALVGMLALLEPVGASLLAYGLFGEVPGIMAVVGMIVVLAAVAFVIAPGAQKEDARRS